MSALQRCQLGLALAVCITAAGRAPAHAGAKPVAARVGVDEHIGAVVPVSLRVTDQRGLTRPLREYLQAGRPLLLSLAYYHCPGLCDIASRELATALRDAGFQLGADYTALTISIDPRDTPASAAAKRASALALLRAADDSAWSFGVTDADTLTRLTQTLGYRYDYDAPTRQYAHPAVSIVLTPEAKIARYLYGPTLEPASVRLALREARLGQGGPTALVDRAIMACFQYDPATRRYSFLISSVMRGGAALIALGLALAIYLFARRARALRA